MLIVLWGSKGFRGTICTIQPKIFDYLTRKINGEDIPIVVEARKVRTSILRIMESLIKRLQPKDFELFVDLIFSRSGWQRIGAIGSIQKTIDIEMVLPTTGQRAFVQVKCSTNQHELDYYIKELKGREEDFMFYIYHTSRYPLKNVGDRVLLKGSEDLSEMALKVGLFDWLLQKAG